MSQAPRIFELDSDGGSAEEPDSVSWRLVAVLGGALVIGLLIVAAAGLAGFEYWWRGTPQYSLKQIGKAVETHDLGLFRKHVDVHSVVNRALDDALKAQAAKRANPQSEAERLGQNWGAGLVEMLRPRLVEGLETQVERFVETGQFQDEKQAQPSLRNMNERMGKNLGPITYVEKEGKVARVGLTVTPEDTKKPIELELRMRETPDGYWQLMEIANLIQ